MYKNMYVYIYTHIHVSMQTIDGLYLDGKRFDWVPEVQLAYWSRIRQGMNSSEELAAWVDRVCVYVYVWMDGWMYTAHASDRE